MASPGIPEGTEGCYLDFQRFAAQVTDARYLLPPRAKYEWELYWDGRSEGTKFKYSWEEAVNYWQQRWPNTLPNYIV